MNAKTDTRAFVKALFVLRTIFYLIFIGVCSVSSNIYFFPIVICLANESAVWIVYSIMKKRNRILAVSRMSPTVYSPEIFGAIGIALFCHGGVIRNEIWFTITVWVLGYLYPHFIFKDDNFDTTKLARHLKKGEYDGAWPKWSELDWFGKMFLYVSYAPMFASFTMFSVAMYASDLPEAAQYKYVMAGGYACTFFAMNLASIRIWYKRVKRTVYEHNLDW